MTPEQIALIRHRMDRARESLEEARLLLEAERFNGSVNRLYYACFYAEEVLSASARSDDMPTGE